MGRRKSTTIPESQKLSIKPIGLPSATSAESIRLAPLLEGMRRRQFAIQLAWGRTPFEAATRAGYPPAQCNDPMFLPSLTQAVIEAGLVGQAEISLHDLAGTELHRSFATLVDLRDHSEIDNVRLSAAKELLAMGINSTPLAQVQAEMMVWTRAERERYMRTGAFPDRRRKLLSAEVSAEEEPPPPLSEGPRPEGEIEGEEDDTGMLA